MSEEQQRVIKQTYLRTEILDAGYNADEFLGFMEQQKKDGGNIDNWKMSELAKMIKSFCDSHQKESLSSQAEQEASQNQGNSQEQAANQQASQNNVDDAPDQPYQDNVQDEPYQQNQQQQQQQLADQQYYDAQQLQKEYQLTNINQVEEQPNQNLNNQVKNEGYQRKEPQQQNQEYVIEQQQYQQQQSQKQQQQQYVQSSYIQQKNNESYIASNNQAQVNQKNIVSNFDNINSNNNNNFNNYSNNLSSTSYNINVNKNSNSNKNINNNNNTPSKNNNNSTNQKDEFLFEGFQPPQYKKSQKQANKSISQSPQNTGYYSNKNDQQDSAQQQTSQVQTQIQNKSQNFQNDINNSKDFQTKQPVQSRQSHANIQNNKNSNSNNNILSPLTDFTDFSNFNNNNNSNSNNNSNNNSSSKGNNNGNDNATNNNFNLDINDLDRAFGNKQNNNQPNIQQSNNNNSGFKGNSNNNNQNSNNQQKAQNLNSFDLFDDFFANNQVQNNQQGGQQHPKASVQNSQVKEIPKNQQRQSVNTNSSYQNYDFNARSSQVNQKNLVQSQRLQQQQPQQQQQNQQNIQGKQVQQHSSQNLNKSESQPQKQPGIQSSQQNKQQIEEKKTSLKQSSEELNDANNSNNENRISKSGVLENYAMKYKCKQTLLTELSKVNEIDIQITDHEIEKRSLFQSNLLYFKVVTKPLNWEVKRQYNDFLLLRNYLLEMHPGIMVPQVHQKGVFTGEFNSILIKKRKNYLEHFLKQILDIKELRNNQFFIEFLKQNDQKMFSQIVKDVKKALAPRKFMDLHTPEGYAEIKINQDLLYFSQNLSTYLESQDPLYNKLIRLSKQLVLDYQQVSKTLYDIGEVFSQFNDSIVTYNNNLPLPSQRNFSLQESFKLLNNINVIQANSITRQIQNVEENYIQFFKFQVLNLHSLKDLLKNRNTFHYEYERKRQYLKVDQSPQSQNLEQGSQVKYSFEYPSKDFKFLRDQFGYFNSQLEKEAKRYLINQSHYFAKHFIDQQNFQQALLQQLQVSWEGFALGFKDILDIDGKQKFIVSQPSKIMKKAEDEKKQ